jgi:hypothetical protein
MARKGKSLADFGAIASDTNINISNDNNSNDKDVIGNILSGKKSKKDTHTFKGYWLENEVANTIDRITEGKPKGVKSELVNEIIKKYLKSEGLM